MAQMPGADPKELIMKAEVLINNLSDHNDELKGRKAEMLLKLAEVKISYKNYHRV